MPAVRTMLKEILSDRKTYLRVIERMSASTVMLPGSHVLIHNPLDHIFTDDEAAALHLHAPRSATTRARLPRWFTDRTPSVSEGDSTPGLHRVTLSPSAVNVVNRVVNLMAKGSFCFSRFRSLALPKKSDTAGDAAIMDTRLLLSRYRQLAPAEKSSYRLMLKPTFPDALVLGALAEQLRKLFPKSYFYRECCAYISGRGTKETVRQVMARLAGGYRVVLRLDVKSFNETVPQESLLGQVVRRAHDTGWEPEDADLLASLMGDYFLRIDEVLGTPGTGIGMGTGLTPLLTNIYLHNLDLFIKERKIPFCRFGDDLVLFFKNLRSAEAMREDSIRFIETKLGQQVNNSKAFIVELHPVPGEQADNPHGFDFCAYHYHIGRDNAPVIRIRDATIGKIRRRIRLITRIPHGRDAEAGVRVYRLPFGEIRADEDTFRLARKIWELSTLLGFPPKRTIAGNKVHTYALGMGWPPSFLNDAASTDIREQFKALDRYILFRLARFEKAGGIDTSPGSRFYQKMRSLGLRTFLDAWNRHPRPHRY